MNKKLLLFLTVGFIFSCHSRNQNIPYQSENASIELISAIKEYASLKQQQKWVIANGATPILISSKRTDSLIPGKGVPLAWVNDDYQNLLAVDEVCFADDFLVLQAVLVNNNIERKITSWDVKSDSLGDNFLLKNGNCFSLEGINFEGKPFIKKIDINANEVKSFWFGFQLNSNDVSVGEHQVELILKSSEGQSIKTHYLIKVQPGESLGFNDSRNFSRLKWLNSTVGEKDEVTKPYSPIRVNAQSVSILGREIQLDNGALPNQIKTFYNGSNTKIMDEGEGILASGFKWIDGDGHKLLENSKWRWGTKKNCRVSWKGVEGNWEVSGLAEFDGFNFFKLKYKAKKETRISPSLSFRLKSQFSKYVMGMGLQGGKSPQFYHWQWDTSKHQDAIWMGGVNGGLMIRLKGVNYERPLVNAYYDYKNINLPRSWGNDGKGFVEIKREADGSLLFTASGGEHSLQTGESLEFNFDLYITPFKPLNLNQQWSERYLHLPQGSENAMADVELAKAKGANVINIHHAREYNPFINYPYNDFTIDELGLMVNKAHQNEQKVKIYYTTRELTNNMNEFFMLYSLDGEVIYPRKEGLGWPATNSKGPHPWLVSNLGENFIPAWRETLGGRFAGMLDLAVITTPDSRWNNFYLEGLNFLIDKSKIDGLYLDDTALDRGSMGRARRLLDDKRPGARIDMHSWNHFNALAGYASASIISMELFAYFDRLWFGEGFDYNNTSEHYWLVEMSGIPFGLMGEMLQGGGNQWRGLVFGETNRLGWDMVPAGQPMNVWSLFDQFGMDGASFIGWWDQDNPVSVSNPKVKASLYVQDNRIMIALASWADTDCFVGLTIDWDALGLRQERLSWSIPRVKGFQRKSDSPNLLNLWVKHKKGLVLIAK